jgi:uncharacterized protein
MINFKLMKCPICEVDLVMSERQGVEIDYCPKCRGVWLDRGELDKIIEKCLSESRPESSQAREKQSSYQDVRDNHDYKKHDDHNGYYSGHKKKSIIGEIFDF